uniref:Putative tick salivary peptide group 1 n=1 Tax=Ixodes ricinus TaxID=34613 RepID=V5HN97_IXORI
MGFTGTTLVSVSLAFFGSAAAHDCQKRTRLQSQKDREGCDFYCWNERTNSYDQFFLHRRSRTALYNEWGSWGYVKNGDLAISTQYGGPSHE